jgi:hypothetical protein
MGNGITLHEGKFWRAGFQKPARFITWRRQTMLDSVAIAVLLSLPKPMEITAQLQQKPRAATNETVVIEGEALIVPHLPASTSQAQKEQKPLLKSLASAMRSMEADMIQLYKDYPPEKIPISIALPTEKYDLAETDLFLSILRDTTIDSFLNEMLNKWNSWTVTLAQYGLASLGPQVMASQRAKPVKPYKFDEPTMSRIVLLRLRSPNAARAYITNLILPDLSKQWEEFRTSMNDRIQKLAEFSVSKNVLQDSDIKRLCDTASIVLFEQIRFALWTCNNIWSMAVNTGANLLKDLSSHSMQTQIDNNEGNGEVIVRQSLIQKNNVILN